jgi:hypothetical protein
MPPDKKSMTNVPASIILCLMILIGNVADSGILTCTTANAIPVKPNTTNSTMMRQLLYGFLPTAELGADIQ